MLFLKILNARKTGDPLCARDLLGNGRIGDHLFFCQCHSQAFSTTLATIKNELIAIAAVSLIQFGSEAMIVLSVFFQAETG